MEIKIFENALFGQVRTIIAESGEPLFCLTDIARVLELNTNKVVQRLSMDVLSRYPISDRLGREQVTNFVNEDGLYDVILDSRKPEAKRFRKWVTSEVLPSIRTKGGYMVSKPEETPEQIMARAILLAQDTIKRQKEALENLNKQVEAKAEEIKSLQPAKIFTDAVSASSKSILVRELAKLLYQNGYKIGQQALFALLREKGYLCKAGMSYNLPTQKAMELGLFEMKKTVITKPDGNILVNTTTKVTGKGQIYFINKFLNKKEIA